MTNFDYIMENLKEIDLTHLFVPRYSRTCYSGDFSERIYDAWRKWAESASANLGNMAAGNHNGKIIKENPSIWAWENWCYPDGSWRKTGRNQVISFQVWLGKQYDPDDWIEEE